MNFDEALEFFKEHLESNKVKIVNPARMRDVDNAYKILYNLIEKCEDTNIEVLSGALSLGDIYIRIITPQLTICNTSLFSKSTLKADTIDIYPTADERIKIDIQFNNAYYVESL